MTLIAFATYGKGRAEFITDSAFYTPSLDWMGQCTKHLTLNHLDAAVLIQGPLDFGNLIRAAALEASGKVASFDELVDGALPWLTEYRQLYRDNFATGGQASHVSFQPTVVLIGWSSRAQEFVAYVFASEQDFAPSIAEGLWAYPMPWSARPTDLELVNLPDHPQVETVREKWATRPVRPKPARTEDWRLLARDARRERSHDYARITIGGHVTHTRLQRGSVISKRIHSYDDTGEEFAKMVSGTLHPVALAEPCRCGSGVPFGECHLAQGLAQPCFCDSGAPLGECCWRTGASTSQPQADLS